VNEAYDVLKDDQKKAAYDRFGHAAFENGMGGGGGGGARRVPSRAISPAPSRMCSRTCSAISWAGGGGGGRPVARAARVDLRYNLRVTLEEAFKGVQKTITCPPRSPATPAAAPGPRAGPNPPTCPTCSGMGKVRRSRASSPSNAPARPAAGMGQIVKNPCKSCGGQGRIEKERTLSVNIPAGVETGTRIRLAGEGEAGLRGGPTGDLYIFIEVKEHAIFQRDGVHLFCRVPVSMPPRRWAARSRCRRSTAAGRVKVPAGSQTGKQMRLRAKGMPALRGGGTGDMLIELAVETPVNLTARQRSCCASSRSCPRTTTPKARASFPRSRLLGRHEGLTPS
jgi:molecular chaperone DnaJ